MTGPFVDNRFVNMDALSFPFFLIMVFMVVSVDVVQRLVHEQEHGLKFTMHLMGMQDLSY